MGLPTMPEPGVTSQNNSQGPVDTGALDGGLIDIKGLLKTSSLTGTDRGLSLHVHWQPNYHPVPQTPCLYLKYKNVFLFSPHSFVSLQKTVFFLKQKSNISICVHFIRNKLKLFPLPAPSNVDHWHRAGGVMSALPSWDSRGVHCPPLWCLVCQ